MQSLNVARKEERMKQCTSCGSELAGSPRFCPSCGTPVEERRSPELEVSADAGPRGKSAIRRVALILFPAVLLGGTAVFFLYLNPSVHSVIQGQPVVSAPHDYDTNFVSAVEIPVREDEYDLVFRLSDLLRHRLVRFEYTGSTTTRPIMAYIDPHGRLVTAISVSEHCGSTEFRIKDNRIYCARCPSNWDMMTMEAYACCAKYYPDPIPSRVIGDEVHITKEVVEKWAGRL
jgi:hypothetical protein